MTDELAALRARVAELERAALDVVGANRESLHESAHGNVNSATIARLTLAVQIDILERILRATTPTPDPRDARIAELTTKLALSEDACLGQNRRAVAAEARLAVLEAALRVVHQAIADYHYALDTRQNGDVACYHAVRAIEVGLELPWKQGAEAERRALGEGHG